MFYRDMVLGCDPTDVQRVVLQVLGAARISPSAEATVTCDNIPAALVGPTNGCFQAVGCRGVDDRSSLS